MAAPKSDESPSLLITCHCGAARQTVRLAARSPALEPEAPGSGPREINLCHCHACRHNTGVLCASTARIETRPSSVRGLVAYQSTTPEFRRWFCGTCGCHVFWSYDLPGGGEMWAVTTGVIIGHSTSLVDDRPERDGDEKEEEGWEEEEPVLRYVRHVNTRGTGDGGLSVFIKYVEDPREELEVVGDWDTPPSSPGSRPPSLDPQQGDDGTVDATALERKEGEVNNEEEDVLNAHCHCKTVRFHISRPDAASRLPRSNFPDLMVPYHDGRNAQRLQNPDDEKWWLRPARPGSSSSKSTSTAHGKEGRATTMRYLAGTCACRSCRLTSGFEIQTWAFVPRRNIFFHVLPPPSSSSSMAVADEKGEAAAEKAERPEQKVITPLDFAALPAGILGTYESSPGVLREFCARCGATVFWHDRWRPDLVDVSVGLLESEDGEARAEEWLDWWTERVSFSEEAGRGRRGGEKRRAVKLVGSLQEGLRRWGEERESGS